MHIIVKLPAAPNPEVVEALAGQLRKMTLPVKWNGQEVGTVIDATADGVSLQVTLELVKPVPPKFRLMFNAMGTPENPIAHCATLYEE